MVCRRCGLFLGSLVFGSIAVGKDLDKSLCLPAFGINWQRFIWNTTRNLGDIVVRKIAKMLTALLVLTSMQPAFANEPIHVSTADENLIEYVQAVETKRVPLIVNRAGKAWFEDNTSADLRRAGRLPLWAVNPGKANAELAVAELQDHQIFINKRYAIPKQPASDVYDTSEVAVAPEIIGADVLHDQGYTGEGKAVAILDTGIQASHEYFKDDNNNSRIVAQACFVQDVGEVEWAKCRDDGDAYPETDFGPNAADITYMTENEQSYMDHGTHVAGLAAGNGNASAPNGIAPDADIVAVRIFGSGGAYDIDILNALDWIHTNAATYDITSVNLSLGGGLYSAGTCYSNDINYLEYWYRIVYEDLIAAGVAPMVATGNDGAQNQISSPACIEPAIAVGSTNAYDTNLNSYESISYFSNLSSQVDLLAPGHLVMSALPGSSYGLMSGTSMATPVSAGAFALLQSISSQSVSYWLAVLKGTGTPLDGDNIQNLPRINVDWAACDVLDCLVPPTNLSFTTATIDATTLNWTESPYGATPTSFEILYDGQTQTVSQNVSSATLTVPDFNQTLQIRSKNGADVSDWAVFQVFYYSNINSYKLKNTYGDQVIDVQLAGDYCTSEVEPYIAFKYESTSSALRKIWISGPNGFTRISEQAYVPQVGEGLTTDNKTKKLLITDPVSVLNQASEGYVVSNSSRGPAYSLADLYAQIENAEYSPSAPTGLSAIGGPSRAVLDWADDQTGLWKVLVDGIVVDEVSNSSAIVSLTPGEHEVSVCSVKVSGQNTYTSIKTTTIVTATPGQYQTIQSSGTPVLKAGGASGAISTSTSSGLAPTYSSQTAQTCSVNAITGVVKPLLVGDCTIQISQSGNATYAAAEPIEVTFSIGKPLPSMVRTLKTSLISGKVKITWKAPANTLLSEVTGYQVKWRVKEPGKKFTSWKTLNLPANSLEYLSKKYSRGSKLEFRVIAFSSLGPGEVSKISRTI